MTDAKYAWSTLSTWAKWRPRAVAPWAHREHRRRPASVHHEALIATAMVVTASMPARVGAEDEAGEEDRADDEDHPGRDANPGGHRG